jgi:SSS family solute:Na+ symporter
VNDEEDDLFAEVGMHWIDWLITIVPVVLVLWMAVYSRKYVRGVVDYLAAGRVAGRYVMCVGSLESSLGVVALVAMVEANYQTGYALGFWSAVMAPVGLIMALTGYCTYRFRETKALSIGQFLEMRYSRSFRIFAATLRTSAEMLTNAIGPAVAANFFIYFMGFPHRVSVLGLSVPTFAIIVASILVMALIVMLPAGRIALLITDSVQGLLSYPIFVIIVGYVLYHFSWSKEIAPVMMDRAPGESFLNPFDIEKLRDFNLFALVVSLLGSILNRASWMGNDTSNCGRTPHEQKMAGILGAWRNGFSGVMCLAIAITVITFMSHEKYTAQAREVRLEIADRVADEVVPDAATRAQLHERMAAVPSTPHHIGVDKPLSREENLDTPYMNAAADVIGHSDSGNFMTQKFRTLYYQMMMPLTLRHLLPVGITGIFCLLMVMLLLATDDSRTFNSSATIVQDVVLPLCKTPLTPEKHLSYLRWATLWVSVFFFFSALCFVNIDFIFMFTTIMCSIWLGGAGPVMVFGLYSRFGNTVGAYASLFFGSGVSIGGLLLQRNWAERVYPFLVRTGWLGPVDARFHWVSAHFSPYVVWRMDSVKFPINSVEVTFVAIVCGVLAYVIGSLVTYRKPYNLERMLHRGEYSTDGVRPVGKLALRWSWRTAVNKLLGITPEFTRGDKILTWSVFIYTFVYSIMLCFVGVLIWNLISPWPNQWWSHYFFITNLCVAAIVGIVSTVWFLIGGISDTKRLMKDLQARVDNPLDDGRVKGHVSLVDVEKIGADADDR